MEIPAQDVTGANNITMTGQTTLTTRVVPILETITNSTPGTCLGSIGFIDFDNLNANFFALVDEVLFLLVEAPLTNLLSDLTRQSVLCPVGDTVQVTEDKHFDAMFKTPVDGHAGNLVIQVFDATMRSLLNTPLGTSELAPSSRILLASAHSLLQLSYPAVAVLLHFTELSTRDDECIIAIGDSHSMDFTQITGSDSVQNRLINFINLDGKREPVTAVAPEQLSSTWRAVGKGFRQIELETSITFAVGEVYLPSFDLNGLGLPQHREESLMLVRIVNRWVSLSQHFSCLLIVTELFNDSLDRLRVKAELPTFNMLLQVALFQPFIGIFKGAPEVVNGGVPDVSSFLLENLAIASGTHIWV